MNTLDLNVTGMQCMGCVGGMKNLLSALPGVHVLEIDLASGRVRLEHDPAITDADAIDAAIEAGGYRIAASRIDPPTAP